MTTITTLIERHVQLHRELDSLYAAGGDEATGKPPYRDIASEALRLEYTIIATPASTAADAASKRAFIETLDDIDLGRLLAAIADLDASAVAA